MRQASWSAAQKGVLLGSPSGRARVPVPPLGQESGSSRSQLRACFAFENGKWVSSTRRRLSAESRGWLCVGPWTRASYFLSLRPPLFPGRRARLHAERRPSALSCHPTPGRHAACLPQRPAPGCLARQRWSGVEPGCSYPCAPGPSKHLVIIGCRRARGWGWPNGTPGREPQASADH